MTVDLDARYRLPRGVTPHAYRLRLEPDLEAATFSGRVSIDVEVSGVAREVTLNSLDLELADASAVLADGRRLPAAVTIDAETERATLRFDQEIAERVELEISFSGVLNDLLVGFYRSTCTDTDGVEQPIATTQFAITDGRRAFPCFDEPALKATFEVTVAVAPGLAAFSNSPVAAESTLPDGRRELRFAPTMKMSTYLVALSVGPFEQSVVIDVDGVPLSVVCTPGKEHLGAFALEIGAFALRFYADYFGIPYPGDKVDLVGVPDFAYGAMENLGCVTFRETLLLIDEATASMDDLQDVAQVVAHELAHMWFGDLVTMQWWEGIWLNEAFATFMEHVCVDAFRPEWRLWVKFSAERERGLNIDGLHSTRPIEFTVHSPADAVAMIDQITYQKGATVLRMLEQYLSPVVFRDGVRRYLADHAYANTVTRDLWAALESVSGQPVGAIMDTWILQGGHPVVHASSSTLSQAPFHFAAATGPSQIGERWQVPVRSRPLHGGAAVQQLLDADPVKRGVAAPGIVNAGGSGAFRTSYEAAELAELAANLGELTEIERAVLIGDTRALARAGRCGVGDVLMIADGLGIAVEPSAWDVVAEQLDLLDRIVTDEQRPLLRARASRLLHPVLTSLGWSASEGEDGRAPLVRATALRVLGTVGADASVRAEAAARFDAGVIEGELASAVIEVVASMARPGDVEVMLERMTSASDPQTAERYRAGIAAFADEKVGVGTFSRCFELFRVQDVPRVVIGLVGNRVTGRAVWEQLAANWDATVERVPPLLQSALMVGVSTFVSDRRFAERVATFHHDHPLETGQKRVDQALEWMLAGVDFAERTRPDLGTLLG